MKRKKEKYVDTPSDKFCKILLYVVLPVIVTFFIFLIKITSFASGIENSAYFPMGQNDNNIVPNVVKEYMDYVFDSENNFILGQVYENGSTYLRLNVLVFSKQSNATVCGEVNNNGYQFSFYLVGTLTNGNGLNRSYYSVTFNKTTGNVSYGSPNGSFWSKTANIYSSLYNQNVAYISNFAVYTTNVEETRLLVLNYGAGNEEPPVIETGHATPPDEFDIPFYTHGHTPPANVPPTITVNNYSWTTYTPPAIDDSGIIETIKSEIQVINYLAGWLKDNIQGMMTNLVNNIKSLFDYLVDTIQYYGNLIISNIQNLITTFYNNMVSIGEDITDKLTYIVSPLDTTALQTAIQNTVIYDDYDRIFDMVGDAFGFYNDIQEPNTFTIPIDLRNVTILHQTQIVYIDLGWLNSCKTIIRAFMWCLLTFGLLYTIIDSIPDYLHGNDE